MGEEFPAVRVENPQIPLVGPKLPEEGELFQLAFDGPGCFTTGTLAEPLERRPTGGARDVKGIELFAPSILSEERLKERIRLLLRLLAGSSD